MEIFVWLEALSSQNCLFSFGKRWQSLAAKSNWLMAQQILSLFRWELCSITQRKAHIWHRLSFMFFNNWSQVCEDSPSTTTKICKTSRRPISTRWRQYSMKRLFENLPTGNTNVSIFTVTMSKSNFDSTWLLVIILVYYSHLNLFYGPLDVETNIPRNFSFSCYFETVVCPLINGIN